MKKQQTAEKGVDEQTVVLRFGGDNKTPLAVVSGTRCSHCILFIFSPSSCLSQIVTNDRDFRCLLSDVSSEVPRE